METAENTYLTFKIGKNIFGLAVDHVVEILEYKEPTTRSNIQPYMIGLIEHRDGVIPQIDTGVKFGMGKVEENESKCQIVISVKDGEGTFSLALVVDEVSDLVEADDKNRQTIESNYKPGYVEAALKKDDSLIMLLDSDKVFADTDIVVMKNLIEKSES